MLQCTRFGRRRTNERFETERKERKFFVERPVGILSEATTRGISYYSVYSGCDNFLFFVQCRTIVRQHVQLQLFDCFVERRGLQWSFTHDKIEGLCRGEVLRNSSMSFSYSTSLTSICVEQKLSFSSFDVHTLIFALHDLTPWKISKTKFRKFC